MNITRPRTRSRAAGLAAALALAIGGTAAVAVGTATHAAARPAAQAAAGHEAALVAKARTSLLRYLSKDHAMNIPTPGGGPRGVTPSTANAGLGAKGTDTIGSYNWSGYADSSSTAGTFTAVSAKWVQPSTTCSSEQRLTAFWVGLDGYSNDTVEQDGTLAYCFEGQPYYFTWWEMFPGASETVGSTVKVGDKIAASVTRSGDSYTLALTDNSEPANSFSTVQTCPTSTCTDESAEWIAERPAFPIGITPLSTFSDWSPYSAVETSNGTRGTITNGPGATQIVMYDATSTYPLDSVSALTNAGANFTTHYLNSY